MRKNHFILILSFLMAWPFISKAAISDGTQSSKPRPDFTSNQIFIERINADTVLHEPSFLWFSSLLGASNAGIVGGLGLFFQQGNKIYSLRYTMNQEFGILGPLPQETVWDAGPMFGWTRKNKYGSFSLSGGLAVTGGVKRGNFLFSSGWFNSYYEQINFSTIGIPVDFRLNWTPSRYFGVGISGFGNANTKRSFWGAGITILIGKLK